MINAAATAAMDGTADRPPVERRRRLSAAALAVTSQKVGRAYSPIVIAGAVRLVDFIMLSLIGIALYFGYVVRLGGFHWEYTAAILAMTATAVICFQAADIYDIDVFRGHIRQMTRMVSSWAFVFLLFIGASFLVKLGSEISRLWLTAFFFVGLAALVTERLILRSLVRDWARHGRLDRRTIVVGADETGEKLVEALKEQDDSDIHMLGVFDDRNDNRAMDTCGGSPKLGKVDDIVEFARRTRVDLVLFALPISAETRILEMLKKLWVLPVDIRLSAHTNKLRFRPRSYSYLGEVPTLDVFEAPITDWDRPGAIPPETIRLQQRAHRRLQVPLALSPPGGSNRLQGRDQGRSARHPRRAFHPQVKPRRIAATVQRRVQEQPLAGRPAPARCAGQIAEPAV
jgi:hypothetical protein